MKKLILIVMLSLCTVTITSRPVQTYAYTEEQKQQAKSWLSAHGYPPTRAGAEQAYQDYMDGKIDVPEADAYLGRNKQTKIEEKKNSTSHTIKQVKRQDQKIQQILKIQTQRIQIQRIQNHRHLLQAKQQRLLQKKQ